MHGFAGFLLIYLCKPAGIGYFPGSDLKISLLTFQALLLAH